MDSCIYCGQDTGSEEHIIPESLGGKLKSKTIICQTCNNTLGSSVDAPFVSQFDFVRNYYGIRSNGGKPPIIRGLVDGSGTEFDILPGGVPQLTNPKVEKTDKEMHFTYRNVAEAKKNLKSIKKKYPKASLQKAEKVTTTLGNLKLSISIGGDELFRGIAKVAFEYFAYIHGTGVVQNDEFNRIRNYISEGADDATNISYFQLLTIPKTLHKIEFPHHSVLILHKEVDEPVVCIIKLFGIYNFQIIVADSWNGIPFSYLHKVNALTGEFDQSKIDVDTIERIPSLHESVKILKSEKHYAIVRGWYEEMMALLDEKSRDALIQQCIEEAWGQPDGRSLTKEDIHKLSTLVAERFVKRQMGLDSGEESRHDIELD
jgi:HNH endonuclease